MNGPTRGQWAFALSVALVRVVAAVWSDPVTVTDSSRYRSPDDIAHVFSPSAGGGPGLLSQILFLVEPERVAIMAQALVVAVAWAVCALYACSVSARSWVALLGVIAISLSPWFLIWDSWFLSEAVSMAALALLTTGVLATRMPGSLLLTVAGGCMALLARPFLLPLIVVMVLVALVLSRDATRLRVAGLLAVTVCGAFAAVQVSQFEGSTVGQSATLVQIRAADRLAGRWQVDGYMASAREAGLPRCAEPMVERLGEDLSPIAILNEPCPDLQVWLARGGLPWAQELSREPVATVRAMVSPNDWVDQSLTPYHLLDGRMYRVFEVLGLRRGVLVANVLMLVVITFSASAAAVSRRRPAFLAQVVLATSLGYAALAWLADGIEYWRHCLPSFLIMSLLWLDRTFEPKRDDVTRR